MTSKSSFLANLKENNKRRLWVWVISALVFMLVFPVVTSIVISQAKSGAVYLSETYGAEVAAQLLHERLISNMRRQMGFSIRIVVVAAVAVISGVQGFSYLYSRKKMDFYMGMPVKRKRRFLILWLNGILLYVLPALLGLLIEMLIAAANGAVDRSVVYSAASAGLVNLWFYLGIYHLTLLAVMMTGNVIITGFGLLVFFLYEYMVRWTINSYKSFFFLYFDYNSTRTEPVFSPFFIYGGLADTFFEEGVIAPKGLALLILFSIITGVLAYVCYLKRPAEAAGKSMTFGITKPVIKILLTVPASLLAGLAAASMAGYEPMVSSDHEGYMIFAILLVVVIGSGVIQVIYEFDLKGALHKKLQILISGVMAVSVFLAFRYDLFGFDSYVPKPEQVESIAFVPQYYEQNMGGAYFDEQGRYLSQEEYAEKYMYLHNVEDVCNLAEHSIEGYGEISDDIRRNYDEEKWGRWSESTLLYRLKNGKKVYRRLMVNVDDKQTISLLDKMIGSEEFKEGYMIGASGQLQRLLSEDDHYKIKVSYGNMVYWEEMSRAEAVELLDIYQRELASANFTNIRENVPEGMLRLQISEEIPGGWGRYADGYERSTRSWYINVNIYSFYEECLNYLKERGYDMDHQLNPEDVAYIQVMNFNTESGKKLAQEGKELSDMWADGEAVAVTEEDYGDNIDTRVYAEYSGKEEIEKIAACCYPEELMGSYDWDRGVKADSDYWVYVYFNTDSPMTKSYGTSANYRFLEGQIPEFVAEDTAYREE